MRNKHVLLCAVAIVAFLLPSTAFAKNVYVGVVSDSPSENGAELQTAVGKALPGDTVFIPEGIYSVDQLVLGSSADAGISLKGEGSSKTKIQLTAASDGVKETGKSFTFSGFTIDGQKTSKYPLRIQGCRDVTLKDIKVVDAKTSAFDFNGVENLTATDLSAVNAGGYGFALNEVVGASFTNCITEGSGWGSVLAANKPWWPNGHTDVDVTGITGDEYCRVAVENYSTTSVECTVTQNIDKIAGFKTASRTYTEGTATVSQKAYCVPRTRVAHNSAELISYLTEQQAGDVISLEATTYDIAKGVDQGIAVGGQKGWYLPIVKDDVTIKGAGKGETVVTSSDVSANGNWASQDFFAIFGNDVTLDGMTIISKIETNKAIEVMGKNATLSNLEIKSNALANDPDNAAKYGYAGAQYSGSIYFNPSGSLEASAAASLDVGKAVVKNVDLAAHISTGGSAGVLVGTIDLDNVNIDWTNFPYAAWDCVDSGWKVNSSNPALTVGDGGFHVSVVATDTVDYTRDILSVVPTNTTVSFGAGSYVFKKGEISRPINLVGTGSDTRLDTAALSMVGTGKLDISDAYQVVHVTGISSPTSVWTMPIGATYAPPVTTLPEDATNSKINWTTEDSKVATVTADGVVSGVAPGITFIDAKTDEGEFVAKIGFYITNPIANGIQLSSASATVLVGETIPSPTVTVMPENARLKSVVWTSNNEDVATVKDGAVKALSRGTARITVRSDDDQTVVSTYTITVKQPVTKITTKSTGTTVTLRRGAYWNPSAHTAPVNANVRGIVFKSSSKYVTMSAKGIVHVSSKAKRGLKITVTFTAKDGHGAHRTETIKVSTR